MSDLKALGCKWPECTCKVPDYALSEHNRKEYCALAEMHVTDPSHGGKVTCYKCNGFILVKEAQSYLDHQHKDEFPSVWFHRKCFNIYEHYYGLDKPID